MKINAMRQLGFVTAALLLAAAVPVYAHHSFAAFFDSTKPVTVQGMFTRVDWVEPSRMVFRWKWKTRMATFRTGGSRLTARLLCLELAGIGILL